MRTLGAVSRVVMSSSGAGRRKPRKQVSVRRDPRSLKEATGLDPRVEDRGPRQPLLLQVLLQEVERARPGHLGGRFVVASALVAVEAMRRVRIGVDLAPVRLPLIASTSVIGMPWSFSPKCICIGTFGFSSANFAIWPP